MPPGKDEASYTRLRQLQSISEAALAHLRFDALLEELLRRLTDLLHADTAAVLLLDEESGDLVARAARGLEEEVERGSRVPLGAGFAGRIAAERRPISIPDVEHGDVLNPILREKGVVSLLGVPLVVEGQVTGVLHVGSLTHRDFTREDEDLLQLVADRIGVAIDHARLYEAEREARAAAERTADRLERLESITEAALANFGLDRLVEVLLERIEHLLEADTVAVFMLEPGADHLVAHAAVGIEGWGPGMTLKVGEGFTGAVAAEGKPRVETDFDEASPLAPAMAPSGIASLLGVPLLVQGRVSGVVTIGTRHRRQFAVKDVELLQLVADRLAMAIENARLYAAEQQARAAAEQAAEQIGRIESITQVALHHVTLDEAAIEGLLSRVRDVLEADTAALLVLDEEEQTLVGRASQGLDEVEHGVRVPLGQGFAGLLAERDEPLAIEDMSEIEVISPLLRAKHVQSMLGVPLRVQGRLLGVLHVGSLERRRFTDDDIRLLELAGDRLAVALAHSRAYEREHFVAETLQRSLLPDRLPDVAGAQLAARYLAGADEAAVGGDWYDAIPLPGGRVGLAMGDVVSRGVRAAATMGQLRNALHAYAVEDRAPAVVLDGVSTILRTREEREMATLVYLVLDPHALTYAFASAGHPPPLVLHPDGSVEYLEEGRSPPLGAVQSAVFAEASGTLEPGVTLLLYTDGLVESRDTWIEEGLERLAAAVEAAGQLDPDALLDRLVTGLIPDGGADDDVAMLALRASPLSPDSLSLRLAADPNVLSSMRRTMRSWLESLGASEIVVYDVLVATTEAAANSVEHAYGPVDATFEVEARAIDADEVEVVVRDQGRWRPPRGHNRGRGTLLMQELMDQFEVVTSDDGTEVRMRRRLAEDGALV